MYTAETNNEFYSNFWSPEIVQQMRAKHEQQSILAQDMVFVRAMITTLQGDEDEINRRVAATELGDLLTVANLPEAVEALIESAKSDTSSIVRRRAIVALTKMRRSLVGEQTYLGTGIALIPHLDNSDPETRYEVVRAIGRLVGKRMDRETRSLVLRRLYDPDEAVRLATVTSLYPIAHRWEVRKALLTLLEIEAAISVRSEAENLLADTASLVTRTCERSSDLAASTLQMWQNLTALQPTGTRYAHQRGAFTPPPPPKTQIGDDREVSGEDANGSIFELKYSIYQLVGTSQREIQFRSEARELSGRVLLLSFTHNKSGISEDSGTPSDQEQPGLHYVLLYRSQGGALGTIPFPKNYGDPIRFDVIDQNQIVPDLLEGVLACRDAQLKADKNSTSAWEEWLEQVPSASISEHTNTEL